MSILSYIPGAALTQQDLLQHSAGSGTREALMVVLASCVVGLGFLIWAAFFYTRRRSRRKRHHHHHRSTSSGSLAESSQTVERESGSRRRRRRRRDHRPRNPTLAETGGLPPVREDRPPAGL